MPEGWLGRPAMSAMCRVLVASLAKRDDVGASSKATSAAMAAGRNRFMDVVGGFSVN